MRINYNFFRKFRLRLGEMLYFARTFGLVNGQTNEEFCNDIAVEFSLEMFNMISEDEDNMILWFNDAKKVRPKHMERCFCKYGDSYRCLVYDDISTYWCTQSTYEHDESGDNHVTDYADYKVTKWAKLV